jgi:hypothetical protein
VVGCILALGWGISIAVYATARPVVENDEIYEMQNSKRNLRELERLGGKAAVLTSELDDWVASLWHGTSLAYTVGVITVIVAGATWFLWHPADAAAHSDAPPE